MFLVSCIKAVSHTPFQFQCSSSVVSKQSHIPHFSFNVPRQLHQSSLTYPISASMFLVSCIKAVPHTPFQLQCSSSVVSKQSHIPHFSFNVPRKLYQSSPTYPISVSMFLVSCIKAVKKAPHALRNPTRPQEMVNDWKCISKC